MSNEVMEKEILSELNKFVKVVGSIQETLHQRVLVKTVYYSWKYKSFGLAEKVLNTLVGVKGSYRVESVAYWFEHVAGIAFDYSDNKGFHRLRFARDAYKSSQNIEFTYDAAHMTFVKSESLRFWKIAPVVIKPLKAPELEKVTTSAEIQLARGLAIGLLTENEIEEHILGMMERVKEALNSKSVKKWTGDYLAQLNPVEEVEEEVSSDLDESLIA